MAEEKMKMSGKIIATLQPKKGVSQKGEWVSQEYVLETNEQYPKKMCFEVYGKDKIEKFAIKIGEEMEVFINIDAREYNGKWYNTIRAWNVKRPYSQENNNQGAQTNNEAKEDSVITDVNQLPF